MTEGTGHGPKHPHPHGDVSVPGGQEPVRKESVRPEPVEREKSVERRDAVEEKRPIGQERPAGPTGSADQPPVGPGDDSGSVPPEFQYLVRGQVIHRGGLPVEGALVRAFHKELAHRGRPWGVND